MTIKDYLGTENARNKANAQLYVDMIQTAFGKERTAVLIGHHLTFEQDNDINTENEVPSADALLFDHDIMGAIFGKRAIAIMQELAALPVATRDAKASEYFYARVELTKFGELGRVVVNAYNDWPRLGITTSVLG